MTHSFLVVAYDTLGRSHAGPAIRTLAFAKELAKIGHVDVVYSGEAPSDGHEGINYIPVEGFEGPYDKYTAALAPPLVALNLPGLLESEIPVCIDLFDPVIWENLDLYSTRPLPEQEFQHERHLAALIAGLLRGDYFLAAGNRQQDLFLGTLMALNRINPASYKQGVGPEQMIGLVPFGLPAEKPTEEISIPDESNVDGPLIVWGGGLWEWLEPDTIVKAMPNILESYPKARLAFPGTRHPNPHVPEPSSLKGIKSTTHNLGIEDAVIFGNWLPRNDYIGLLMRASCGVSAHKSGLESRYAVRTRFLDAIWTGLPMVVSGGDEYSGIISENDIGIVVGECDGTLFANAIMKVLDKGRESYAGRFDKVRAGLTWEKTSKPLVDWMKAPRMTHDQGGTFFQDTLGAPSPRSRPGDLGSLMGRVLSKLKKM